MVIQANMSPQAIMEVWENTKEIFESYNVPFTRKTLQSLVHKDVLPRLLRDLNEKVGSSEITCIEGG
ncbi:hypothetical protein [Bacillus sp. B1-b2]|uniref:hypothetical protein n=1 Tax=Bacillus sp. B1-b2 TaxID=2653201 RepID=UPI001261E346|nr:hypothetical protein [Bacillus sp. B1-b2]KAB7664155.1 hypothetical protein F9279_23145 [Bacillus sp. B1-b2]